MGNGKQLPIAKSNQRELENEYENRMRKLLFGRYLRGAAQDSVLLYE